MFQGVFYKAGSAVLTNDKIIRVDKACALMIRFLSEGCEISVANPENKACLINIYIKGETEISVKAELAAGEKGNQGGKSFNVSKNRGLNN